MHRTRIKICGICEPEHARAAVEAGADAIGLVFVERSPRHVSVERAIGIVRTLPAYVEPVGLFVDETAHCIEEIATAVGLRTVQLHGHEPPETVRELSSLRVVKAMGFAGDAADAALKPWREARLANLAAILLDAPPPGDADLPGGSGQVFDWKSLASLMGNGGLDGLPPLVLAGGLTPTNVAHAISTLRPFAVDVSSGVESSRGAKDAKLIASFCRAVRAADAAVAMA